VNKTNTILQADKSAFKAKKSSAKNKMALRKMSKREEYMNVDALDFSKKILHASWHPRENVSCLFIFSSLTRWNLNLTYDCFVRLLLSLLQTTYFCFSNDWWFGLGERRGEDMGQNEVS
jgi:hypothetical protein